MFDKLSEDQRQELNIVREENNLFITGHSDWLGRTDSFLYLGKLHWFLYLLLSYFYDPGMFIFRWSSNFVENVVLKGSMAAKMASRVSYLVYYYCIYSEFEQIITKLRWSIRDNNN